MLGFDEVNGGVGGGGGWKGPWGLLINIKRKK